jgi:serine/threonine-protein kinase
MAPELHRRIPSVAQSDLYSAGILGIELLTGRPLFRAMPEKKLMEAKQDLPDRLEEILPHYVQESTSFMTFLRALVNPDPDRRYISSREAESGQSGLFVLNRELVQMNVDAEYERELETYISKIVDSETKQFAKLDQPGL